MAADDGPRAGSGKRPEVRDPDVPPAQPAGVTYRPLVPGMRVLLYVAAVLVLLAGFQLFVFTGRTDTYFAWSGPTRVEPGKNGSSYYRIQGPHLVIEYAPQHDEDHIHTIYRDPINDYGKALVAQ